MRASECIHFVLLPPSRNLLTLLDIHKVRHPRQFTFQLFFDVFFTFAWYNEPG